MLVALLVVLGLVLAACGDDSDNDAASNAPAPSSGNAEWDGVVEAAKKEGKLVVYSAEFPEKNTKFKAAFEKAYPGIGIEFFRATSADLAPKVEAEHKANSMQASGLIGIDWAWQTARAAEGYFTEPSGPEFEREEIKKLRRASAVTMSGLPYGFAYNPTKITSLTLEQMVSDPKYKGRIGTYEPRSGTNQMIQMHLWGEQYGKEFLTKLAAQNPKFYPGASAKAQAVAAGEIDIAWPMVTSAIGNLPLKLEWPKETLTLPYYVTVMSKAPSPNAARVFANWLFTKEGQSIASEGQVDVIGGSTTAVLHPEDVRFFDSTQFNADQQKTIGEDLRKTFGR